MQTPRVGKLETVIPGEVIENGNGTCYVVTERYPLHVHRGAQPLAHLLDHHPATFAAFHPAFGLQENIDFRQAVFLDTETTGLGGGAGVYCFMVGVGTFEEILDFRFGILDLEQPDTPQSKIQNPKSKIPKPQSRSPKPQAPSPKPEARSPSYPFTSFQSSRNLANPLSVSGWCTSCLNTLNGMVLTSAPAMAASSTWIGWRMLATRISVSKP